MPDFFLLRSVLASLGDDAGFPSIQATIGSVEVAATQPVTHDGEPAGTVLVARTPIEDLESGMHPMPGFMTTERRRVESMLESMVRLVALDERAAHRISSPHPFVGIGCDDETKLRELAGKRVPGETMSAVLKPGGSAGVIEQRANEHISDRLDGVALLAEALNHDAAVGQYGQLLRLFERAFRLGPAALTDPLKGYLVGHTSHGFTETEVADWIGFRGPAVHADRRDNFLLESDLRPVVPRMLQAGYDVLFNKQTWRDPSPHRRDCWRAPTGTSNDHAGVFITQGQGVSMSVQVLDGYRAYPQALMGPFDPVLPRAAWLIGDATGGVLELRGEGQFPT